MKKKLLIAPAVVLSVLAACAQPDPQLQAEMSAETNISMESGGNFESVDSSDASSAESQAGGDFTQLQSVDGTTVTETIGEGDYVLTLDADVHIPDASPQEGTFAAKSLDLSAIEDALGNGETLSPGSSGTRYTSQDSSISFFCSPPAPLVMPCLKIRI